MLVIFMQLSATRECAISEEDLRNKPYFEEVVMEFVSWIDDMVKLAKKKHGKSFLPGKVVYLVQCTPTIAYFIYTKIRQPMQNDMHTYPSIDVCSAFYVCVMMHRTNYAFFIFVLEQVLVNITTLYSCKKLCDFFIYFKRNYKVTLALKCAKELKFKTCLVLNFGFIFDKKILHYGKPLRVM